MNNSKKYIVRAIYRKVNDYPVVMDFSSMKEIWELLGRKPLTLTEIGIELYAISRAKAREHGEPFNMHCVTRENDGTYVTTICGDVVVIGYNPKLELFKSLTQEQIDDIMITPKDNPGHRHRRAQRSSGCRHSSGKSFH